MHISEVSRKDKILCFLILFNIIFGNAVNFSKLRIAGIVVTLYRLMIPLIAFYFLLERFQKKEIRQSLLKKPRIFHFILISVWILYGMLLACLSQYASPREGLKELLQLFLGSLVFFCITEYCREKKHLFLMISMLKRMIVVVCIWALFEMIIGLHLPTSRYYVDIPIQGLKSVAVLSVLTPMLYPATGFFWGLNDYAAFFTIFFPLFFINGKMSKKQKFKNIIPMCLILIILSVQDANICMIGIFVAMLFWIILDKKKKYAIGSLGGSILVTQWISGWMCSGIIAFKTFINKFGFIENIIQKNINSLAYISDGGIKELADMKAVFKAQIASAEQGNGSLYTRVMVMFDSLEMAWKSKFAGVGPAAFSEYLKQHGSRTSIINPHNLWLEILSEYGIGILLLYVAELLYLFCRNLRLYLFKREDVLLHTVCMFITYFFAAIAPSSYLGYGYQWIVVALSMVALDFYSE